MDSERNGIIDKWIRQKSLIDLFVIVLASIVVFLLASRHDLLETIENYSRQHEKWELDELITVAIFLVFSAVVFGIRRWVEIKRINTILKQKIEDLRKASAEIKQLKEIIPICSNCKNIRDDKGFWHRVDTYIHTHSEIEFSHGICPECMKELYPEFMDPEE